MAMRVKINPNSGLWPQIKSIYVKINAYSGYWKEIKTGYIKTSAYGWMPFHSASTGPTINTKVSLSKNTGSDDLVTLTGTNHTWTSNTGETYKFEKSLDGTNFLSTSLSSGNAVNDGVYTYKLINGGSGNDIYPMDVTPDATNYFRFTVSATDSYGTTTSASSNVTVIGPETPSITSSTSTFNSITVNWTASPNATMYTVYYRPVSGSTYTRFTNGNTAIYGLSATIDGLSPNTSYYIRVAAWTGTGDSYGNGTGYTSYLSNIQTFTTNAAPNPTQLTRPTLSTSVAYPFYPVNGTSGTYQSGTYSSKATYIAKTTDSSIPVDGSNTDVLTYAGVPPYTVKQIDATSPSNYFYYVDAVTSYDGTKVFYFYSNRISSSISSYLSDDFNRTVSNGVGFLTPDFNGGYNPTTNNAYFYNLVGNSSAWSVSGSYAVSSVTVTGTNPNNYPTAAIELSGRTNLNLKVDLPGKVDGLGLMFWATSSGSWWASTITQTKVNQTQYTYYLNKDTITCTKVIPSSTGSCNYSVQYYTNRSYTCTTYLATRSYTCTTYYTNRAYSCMVCPPGYSPNGAVCEKFVNVPGLGLTRYTTGKVSSTCYACDSPTASSVGSCGQTTNTCSACDAAGSASNNCGTTTSTCYVCDSPTASSIGSCSMQTTYYGNETVTVCDTDTPYYTSGTLPTNCSNSSSTVTYYNTNLNILSADGYNVTLQSTKNIDNNSTGFTNVDAISVNTSGDIITVNALSSNSTKGSLSYTASGSTKKSFSGFSAAGIIKGPAGDSPGQYFDNLIIS